MTIGNETPDKNATGNIKASDSRATCSDDSMSNACVPDCGGGQGEKHVREKSSDSGEEQQRCDHLLRRDHASRNHARANGAETNSEQNDRQHDAKGDGAGGDVQAQEANPNHFEPKQYRAAACAHAKQVPRRSAAEGDLQLITWSSRDRGYFLAANEPGKRGCDATQTTSRKSSSKQTTDLNQKEFSGQRPGHRTQGVETIKSSDVLAEVSILKQRICQQDRKR
jgi:hypothetical protein